MSLGFFIIVSSFVVGDIVAWRLAAQWLRRLAINRHIRLASHAFFALQTAYSVTLVTIVLLSPMLSRHSLDWIPNPLQALIYIWHIIFLPIAILAWTGSACVLAGRRLGSRLASIRKATPPAASPSADLAIGPSRRSVLLASVATLPPLLSIGATGYGLTQTWKFRVNRLNLALPDLPIGLDGFRIAHVSDLHVGRWSTRSFLDDVVDATNSLQADMVAFTGDLIDISIEDLPLAIETYKRFRSRHGSFMVEGNHDLIDDALAFRNAVAHEGLRFLRDGTSTIDTGQTPLQLLGIGWSRSEADMRRDVALVSTYRQADAYPILLAHHPHAFDAAAAAGLPLTLAGHTHGGLLAINRDIAAGSLMFRYISGIYTQGNSRLLVSNGTGNWFPLRINAPAEIIDITLRRAT